MTKVHNSGTRYKCSVAVTADISKMYRAVELAEENRDLHRFLWRATPEEPIND